MSLRFVAATQWLSKASQLGFTFGPRKPVEDPGSHGSTKWYRDREGKVIYGARPATPLVTAAAGPTIPAAGTRVDVVDPKDAQWKPATVRGHTGPWITVELEGGVRMGVKAGSANLRVPNAASAPPMALTIVSTPTIASLEPGDHVLVHQGVMQDARGATRDFGWERAVVEKIEGRGDAETLHYRTDEDARGMMPLTAETVRVGWDASPPVTAPLATPRPAPPAAVITPIPTTRPSEAKTYATDAHAKVWEVLRHDYENRAVELAKMSNARTIDAYRAELATLSPRKKVRRDDVTTWLRFAEQRKAQLDAHDEDVVNAVKRHAALTYMQTVKGAISKGMSVPMAVIAQDLTFRKALTARERYEKGRATSFANISSAVDASMQEARGYKIKRQNGKPMTAALRDEIAQGVTEVETVLGSLKDVFAMSGLTVAHTGGVHPFLTTIGGQYLPGERTISVGIMNRFTGKPIRALAHELGHFLDDEAGRRLGRLERVWRGQTLRPTRSLAESDAHGRTDGETSRTLIREATQTMTDAYAVTATLKRTFGKAESDADKGVIEETKVTLGPYWRAPCEVQARLFEQYIATKTGAGGIAMKAPEQYEQTPGYWRREVFGRFLPQIEREIQRRLTILRTSVSSALETTA